MRAVRVCDVVGGGTFRGTPGYEVRPAIHAPPPRDRAPWWWVVLGIVAVVVFMSGCTPASPDEVRACGEACGPGRMARVDHYGGCVCAGGERR